MRTRAWAAAGAALQVSIGAQSAVTIPQQAAAGSYLEGPSTSVSADGRFVAFSSYARLAPADTNDVCDIYVLDRDAGNVMLESIPPHGGVFAAGSLHPAMSGDGRFLVFDVQGAVVLRDRRDATGRVLGAGALPSISRDGRYVTFTERGSIYMYEVQTGTTRAVAREIAEGAAPLRGMASSISGDGRLVAFTSRAGPASTGRFSQIYVYDTRLDTTAPIARGVADAEADGDSWGPVISADGTHVAFVSAASNLTADDRNHSPDVFIADLLSGEIELVSRGAGRGSANGPSGNPAISADGRFVAFDSEASDLVCSAKCPTGFEDINLVRDVFLFDRLTRSTTVLSADATGVWMEASSGPALDAAAGVVAFSSRHAIGSADAKNDFDLFIVRR